jgi:3D (Asp-Asp-Asp) domain-containing protein
MSMFEATENIQPHRNLKHYRLVRKKTGRYFWAVLILFMLVAFLCINNYFVLNSYKEIRNQLDNAYLTIDNQRVVKTDLTNTRDELQAQNMKLAEEIRKIKENYEKTSRGNEDIAKQLDNIKKLNNDLIKKNKELVDDNVALQNSLKMAASAGLKPQNYSKFEGLDPRSSISKGKYLGKFLGTAYTPSIEECGNSEGITNSGEPIMPGVSVAIDNKYWPFGTVFYIKGLGYAVAMDTGSAIKGKYRFDFSVFDKKFAQKLGSRKWDVYLVKLGAGLVKDIDL